MATTKGSHHCILEAAYGIVADNICCSGRSKQPQQISLDGWQCAGGEQKSVWPVARLHTICGMMSVRSQFQHNCWIQSRIHTTALGHQRIIHKDAVAVLISARNSRINCHNRAPEVTPNCQTRSWTCTAAACQNSAGRVQAQKKGTEEKRVHLLASI